MWQIFAAEFAFLIESIISIKCYQSHAWDAVHVLFNDIIGTRWPANGWVAFLEPSRQPHHRKEQKSCGALQQRRCQSIRLPEIYPVNVGIRRHKHQDVPAHACAHTHAVTQHLVRHPCFIFRRGSAAPALQLRDLSRPSRLLWHGADGCIRGCERNNVWKLKWT